MISLDWSGEIQRSYIWTRVCKFIWPFILVIALVRAIIMIVELQRGYVFSPMAPFFFQSLFLLCRYDVD